MSGDLVLVSGASGYLGSWIVKTLQEHGYRVRGTVRSLKNKGKVDYLYNLCSNPKFPVELVEADLMKADTWPAAVQGCKYVVHCASPFTMDNSNPEAILKPAVEGALSVLRAVAEAGTVERVVLTSSYAAVVESGRKEGKFTDEDWSIPDKQHNVYMRSKTLAEKAAWDFVKDLPHGKRFGLCTILPVAIMGPPLSNNTSESIDSIAGIFEGRVPIIPKLTLNIVDVRDVAEAHARCLTTHDAAGKRFILDAGNMYFPDMVKELSSEFGPQGYKIPTRQMPKPIMRFASHFSEQVKDMRSLGEVPKYMDTDKLRNLLGISPRDPKNTINEMVYALIEHGQVHKTDKYHGPQS